MINNNFIKSKHAELLNGLIPELGSIFTINFQNEIVKENVVNQHSLDILLYYNQV